MSQVDLVDDASSEGSEVDAFLLAVARTQGADPLPLLTLARSALDLESATLWKEDYRGRAVELAHASSVRPSQVSVPSGWSPWAAAQRSRTTYDAGGSHLLVPVWIDGEPAGLVQLSRGEGRAWTRDEQLAGTILGDRIAALLEGDESLRERELQLAEAQAIAMIGSWEWTVGSNRIVWSDEQFRLHGREPVDQVTYEWFFSHIHPEDRAWFGDAMQRVVTTGESFEFPYRIVRADGETRWLYARGKMLIPANGEPGTMLGTSQDITAQRDAQEALRASEESYRTIFDSSNDAVFIHDLSTGSLLDANRRACEMYGLELAELRTRGVELIGAGPPPFSRELALEYIRNASAGSPQRFEWCTLHPDTDEEMWVEVSLQRVHIRGDDRILALVRDIRERKKTEAALVVSEEAYRTIFKHSSEAIWVHEVSNGAMLDVNDAGSEMYGYTFEEMMEAGHDALLFPGSEYTGEKVIEYMGRAVNGESPRFEWMGRRKDGSAVWGEVTLRLVKIGGRPRILASARDISERKTAEEALRRANEELEGRVVERTAELADTNDALQEEIAERKSAERALKEREEHFRALIENAHDITSIIDADGRMLYTTPSFHRITGWGTEDLLGQNVFDFFHPEDAERDAPVLRSIVENPGSVGRSIHRFRHSNGSYRYLEAFGRTLSPHSAAEGVVVNIRDITERKQAEDALRASEEYFRRLIENASDFIMIVRPHGEISYVGPSVERILGYRPDEMVGMMPVGLVHTDDQAAVLNALADIVAIPGKVRTDEFRVRHKDGSWRVLEIVGKTLSPDRADEGVVANGRDVTERRRAEKALREATEVAERANLAKSEFLSRMSHELRTPMNSILGFAQVLETSPLETRQEKCVQHILRAGRHLLQLINEVLQIAAIEAGRQHLSLEPVRASTVLREAIELARPMAAQSRVDLEYAAGELAEGYVRADRQRLTQVVLNLLSNAVKYNRAGGRVRVGCETVQTSGSDRPRLRIWVEDTGRGIPPERWDQLFTPFARLGAENGEIEGTGLGLALSQRLAEAMGGSLRLGRSGDSGSLFVVELDTAASPLGEIEDTKPVRGEGGIIPDHRPASILYIEDNLANLSLVETILWERPNWRTIPALQGQVGVDLAREHIPDLILLDLHLPDMRGEEVMRRLQADPRTASIPIVVISADATSAATERLLAAGAVAFLHKPIDVQQFLDTLSALLTPHDPAE